MSWIYFNEASFSLTTEKAFRIIREVIDGSNRYAVRFFSPGKVVEAIGGKDYDPYLIWGITGGLIGVPLAFILSYAFPDSPHPLLPNFMHWELVRILFVAIGLSIYYASVQRTSLYLEVIESSADTCRVGFTHDGRSGTLLENSIVEKLSGGITE